MLGVFAAVAGCSFAPSASQPPGSDEPAIDAPSIDAPGLGTVPGDAPPDAPPCPTTYTNGYRLDATSRTWLDAERACEADQPGRTHLVVLDDAAERIAVSELIQTLPADPWVGIVRDPGEPPWQWRYVTGGAATFAPFEDTEPNNMSGNQLVIALRRTSRLLYDYGIDRTLPSVCECDGDPPVDADYDPATP